VTELFQGYRPPQPQEFRIGKSHLGMEVLENHLRRGPTESELMRFTLAEGNREDVPVPSVCTPWKLREMELEMRALEVRQTSRACTSEQK
jgi:hypothetical protein